MEITTNLQLEGMPDKDKAQVFIQSNVWTLFSNSERSVIDKKNDKSLDRMNMNVMTGRSLRSTLVVKNMIRSTPTGANNCCTFLLHTTQLCCTFFL